MPSPFESKDLFGMYAKRLGFNVDPERVSSEYFQTLYTACYELAKANIHPDEPCVVAGTTSNKSALFAKSVDQAAIPVREVEAWVAARMIASGKFRLGTAREHDRCYEERREAEQLCKDMTSQLPENRAAATAEKEHAHTRELLSTLVGAVANPDNKKGPGRPAKPTGEEAS